MSIKHEFNLTPQTEQELITLDQWVSTLPADEQIKFQKAERRQRAHRQQMIDANKLTVIEKSENSNDKTILDDYVWDESHCENKSMSEYKKYDNVWLFYWNRYLEETKTTFEIVETKV